MQTIYNEQLENTTDAKRQSKCRLNVNSKLSLKVTCDKARLKTLSSASAFDDSNGHEIK